jgi:hypothetical protein
MSKDPPSPPEIARSPEIAVLSVLDVALEASARALAAAYPEIVAEDAQPVAGPALCAERIVGHTHKLQLLLASYISLVSTPKEDPLQEDSW